MGPDGSRKESKMVSMVGHSYRPPGRRGTGGPEPEASGIFPPC